MSGVVNDKVPDISWKPKTGPPLRPLIHSYLYVWTGNTLKEVSSIHIGTYTRNYKLCQNYPFRMEHLKRPYKDP